MDPLSEVLSLLRPTNYAAGAFGADGLDPLLARAIAAAHRRAGELAG